MLTKSALPCPISFSIPRTKRWGDHAPLPQANTSITATGTLDAIHRANDGSVDSYSVTAESLYFFPRVEALPTQTSQRKFVITFSSNMISKYFAAIPSTSKKTRYKYSSLPKIIETQKAEQDIEHMTEQNDDAAKSANKRKADEGADTPQKRRKEDDK